MAYAFGDTLPPVERAFVRSVADGNETVPTMEAVAAYAPHLLSKTG